MLQSPAACSSCRIMHPAACSVHAQCCKFLRYVTGSCTLWRVPCTMQTISCILLQVPAPCCKFLHPAASSCTLLQVPAPCCKTPAPCCKFMCPAASCCSEFLHPADLHPAATREHLLFWCYHCYYLVQTKRSGVTPAAIWCTPTALALLMISFGAHQLLWCYS